MDVVGLLALDANSHQLGVPRPFHVLVHAVEHQAVGPLRCGEAAVVVGVVELVLRSERRARQAHVKQVVARVIVRPVEFPVSEKDLLPVV